MPIKLDCPNCRRSLTVPESEAGLPAICNACGKRLVIPGQARLIASFAASEPDHRFRAVEQRAAGSDAAEKTAGQKDADDRSDPPAEIFAALPKARGIALPGDAFKTPGGSPVPQRGIALPGDALKTPGGSPVPRKRIAPKRRSLWSAIEDSQWMAVGITVGCLFLLGAISVYILPHWTKVARTVPADEWEARHFGEIQALIDEADGLIIAGDLSGAGSRYQHLTELIGGRSLSDPVLRADWDRAVAQKQRVAAALVDRTLRGAREPSTSPAIASSTVRPSSSPDGPWDPETDPNLNHQIVKSSVAATAPAVRAPRPRPQANPLARQGITDDQIGAAIAKGANWLLAQMDAGNRPRGFGNNGHANDLSALCVYALLQCGQAISDPRLELHNSAGRIRPLLDTLEASTLEASAETYGRALRANALVFGDQPADKAALKKDFTWLVQSQKAGKYGYNASNTANGNWDNSNSQYGLLGVWAGAEAGMEVPNAYWQQVLKHWTETQNQNGTWGYRGENNGTLTMTLAGIASLFVAHDYLEAPQLAEKVGRPPYTPALQKGLAWLEEEEHAISVNGRWEGYALYGVERVGLASGFKTFGKHDWYRELATRTLADQMQNGSWSGDLVETSYALLFLSRGRHPILMNKLRFEGFWANRPRDLANLCRFASKEMERPINWQVVSADSEWTDWMDSPVLYLSSHVDPKLPPAVIDKIRQFVEAGGMLFTQADGGLSGFDDFSKVLARQLFPQFPMTDVPADSELYKVLYTINPRPPLKMVSNGARVLMVHSPRDISMAWQQRAEKSNAQAFRLGVNLFLYASGKHDLRNRLASTYLPEMPVANGEIHHVSRVQYSGNWNPEPAAWTHFSRWFQGETGEGIEVSEVAMSALAEKGAAFAHLTGAAAFTPSEEEVTALRDYVDGGGTVLIDACGGNLAFADSATQLISRAFPDTPLKSVGDHSPLLSPATMPGMDDLQVPPELRPFARTKLGKGAGMCQILTHGRGRVLYSWLDVTSGLLGTRTWGILGYEPAYAEALMKNAMLWAEGAGRAGQ